MQCLHVSLRITLIIRHIFLRTQSCSLCCKSELNFFTIFLLTYSASNLPPWTCPWLWKCCSCAFWWGALSLSERTESKELPVVPKLSAEVYAFLLENSSVTGDSFLRSSARGCDAQSAPKKRNAYYFARARFLEIGLRTLEYLKK